MMPIDVRCWFLMMTRIILTFLRRLLCSSLLKNFFSLKRSFRKSTWDCQDCPGDVGDGDDGDNGDDDDDGKDDGGSISLTSSGLSES